MATTHCFLLHTYQLLSCVLAINAKFSDDYFLKTYLCKIIRMMFCRFAPFTHEKNKYMGIHFHRNFITSAKHVVVKHGRSI